MDQETKGDLLELLDLSCDGADSDFEECPMRRMNSNSAPANGQEHKKIYDFMDTIDNYSEAKFKSHFHLNRSTVEQLHAYYYDSGYFVPALLDKAKIRARKEVYLYVWYITNTITFKEVAKLFDVAESTTWAIVQRVSSWLISKAGEYIKWPKGDTIVENCRKFETGSKFQGVIGAIDCIHIPIRAPKLNQERYHNQKQYYSLALQAVVDADKKFIAVYCAEPGSLGDSGVLRKSSLYKEAQTKYAHLFPSNTFILGNSAYPATKWLVPPFRDSGQLTDEQMAFNNLHSAAMMVVENTFGLLKGRFRRLTEFTEQRNLCLVKKMIVSACILHNICITENDQYNKIYEERSRRPSPCSAEQNVDVEHNLSANRRQILFNSLCKQNII